MIFIDFKDFPQEFDKFPVMEDLTLEQQEYINENGISGFADKFPSTVTEVEGRKISKVFFSAFHINWIADIVKSLHGAFKRMWSHQGIYSSSKYYYKGDMVTYSNKEYLCVKDCSGITPTNTTYWKLFSGKDGTNGVSPTVSINKQDSTATITITDVNGTKSTTLTDGVDGVLYYLKPSDSIITLDENGNFYPSSISVTAYEKVGSQNATPKNCAMTLYYITKSNTDWQVAQFWSGGNTWTRSLTNTGTDVVKFKATMHIGPNLVDEITIPVVSVKSIPSDLITSLAESIEELKDKINKLNDNSLKLKYDCSANNDGSVTGLLFNNGKLFVYGTGAMINANNTADKLHKLGYINEVTDVYILDGVTSLGSNYFKDCNNLTNVNILGNITNIGYNTFQNCTNLISINIPYGVTTLYNNVFRGCSSLKKIEIPDSVTSIGGYAFASCTSLTNITIPSSVTTIAQGAFSSCSGLTSIIIPDSVTTIESSAFNGCKATIYCKKGSTADNTSLYPGTCTIKYITDEDKFEFDSTTGAIIKYSGNDSDVVIPNTIDGVAVTTIGKYISGEDDPSDGVFDSCGYLINVDILSGVTKINRWTLNACSNLENVVIPDSVMHIDSRAFVSCSNLKTIAINKPAGSITGSPWGANNVEEIIWNGGSSNAKN